MEPLIINHRSTHNNNNNNNNSSNNNNNNGSVLKNLLSFLYIPNDLSFPSPRGDIQQLYDCEYHISQRRNASEIFPLESLPEEIVIKVLSFLSGSAIYIVSRTNHDLNRLCAENRLWRKVAQAAWHIQEKKHNYLDWRGYYQLKCCIQQPDAVSWSLVPAGSVRPSRRYQHSATAMGNKIYFIGGQETQTKRFDDIFEFDTEQLRFKKITLQGDNKPPRFARHTAIAIGKNIFIFGGFDGMSTYYELSIFDTEAHTWTNPPVSGTPPRARTNHAAAAIGNNIYMFGGITRDCAGELQDLDEFYVLQTDTMTWRKEECVGLPAPRCGHRLLVVGGKLYLFGGGAGDAWLHKFNDMHIYDPSTHEWTKPTCTGSVDVCTFSSVFALGSFIFVFGGQLIAKGEVCSLLYAFDSLTNEWHTLHTAGLIPPARDMASVSVVGAQAYLFGGYNGKPLEDMHVFRMKGHLNRMLENRGVWMQ